MHTPDEIPEDFRHYSSVAVAQHAGWLAGRWEPNTGWNAGMPPRRPDPEPLRSDWDGGGEGAYLDDQRRLDMARKRAARSLTEGTREHRRRMLRGALGRAENGLANAIMALKVAEETLSGAGSDEALAANGAVASIEEILQDLGEQVSRWESSLDREEPDA